MYALEDCFQSFFDAKKGDNVYWAKAVVLYAAAFLFYRKYHSHSCFSMVLEMIFAEKVQRGSNYCNYDRSCYDLKITGKLPGGSAMQLLGTDGKESEEKVMERVMTGQAMEEFRIWLVNAEKCPATVQKYLRDLKKAEKIETGPIFLSSRGNPVDRSNLGKQLKVLAEKSGIDKKKVYPHNFRHMFARCFYKICLDIVKVAALLGHSNTKTTMNYLKTTKQECRDMLNKMNIIMC